jgi:hypothetical protein
MPGGLLPPTRHAAARQRNASASCWANPRHALCGPISAIRVMSQRRPLNTNPRLRRAEFGTVCIVSDSAGRPSPQGPGLQAGPLWFASSSSGCSPGTSGQRRMQIPTSSLLQAVQTRPARRRSFNWQVARHAGSRYSMHVQPSQVHVLSLPPVRHRPRVLPPLSWQIPAEQVRDPQH